MNEFLLPVAAKIALHTAGLPINYFLTKCQQSGHRRATQWTAISGISVARSKGKSSKLL